MLVLTSRYGEETALRALRYFASFAFNVSLFLERIPCAKLAKYRKARGRRGGPKEDRPYRASEFYVHPPQFSGGFHSAIRIR